MSIASIAEGVAQRYPNVTILGYADDYRFIGPWRDAMDAALEYRHLVVVAGHVPPHLYPWPPR
jgi:delta-aminolevulinic acid dehydratase/porphobilinogen synthase